MREFKFEPANEWNSLDARKGRRPSVWTFEDVKYAILAHTKCYSTERTKMIFTRVTGIRLFPTAVCPTRYFGELIAEYAKDIANRAHVEDA